MKQRMIGVDADIVSRNRSIHKPGEYTFLPKVNRVPSYLPGMEGISIYMMTSPQSGADFLEYELEIAANGRCGHFLDDGLQQFMYIMEGALQLEMEGGAQTLSKGGYFWLPPGQAYRFGNRGDSTCRALWLRKPFVPAQGVETPGRIISHEKDVPKIEIDTYLVRHLLPYQNLAFDMAMNLQYFEPGVHFSYVETHVMEHGLYILEGRGVYWMNGDYMEAQKDDFIYMAPFCPQFYYATGGEDTVYLNYKDINRDFAARFARDSARRQ